MATKAKPKTLTMAEILEKKKAVLRSVKIQIDGEIAVGIQDLQEEVRLASRRDRGNNLPDTAPALQKKLDALIKKGEKTIVTFTFKSIGRTKFEAMVRKHKPDQQDKKDGSIFNTKTFPPELIAAASVEPEITIDEAKEMFDDEAWNNAELAKIFMAANSANAESPDIPLSSNGSVGTPATG